MVTMEIPELSDATDAVERKARNLVPWLPDPYVCDSCGEYCKAERVYDPQQAAFYPMGMAPAWVCPKCEAAYHREPWDG